MTNSTVAFWLAGPMQAWSCERRTSGMEGRRPSADHPTKSGVVGLVANALGRDRSDPIDDLAALTFGVRCDRAGTFETDFHTAGGGRMPGWDDVYGAASAVSTNRRGQPTSKPLPNPVVSRDTYLADAVFLAALGGDAVLVHQIAEALTSPARPVHLGRAAYPTTGRLLEGVFGGTVDEVLSAIPRHPRADEGPLTVRMDGRRADAQVVHDVPLHFGRRQLSARWELTFTVNPRPLHPFDPFCPPQES